MSFFVNYGRIIYRVVGFFGSDEVNERKNEHNKTK